MTSRPPVIAVITRPDRATSHVRVRRPAQFAEKLGLAKFVLTSASALTAQHGSDYDAVLVQRDTVSPEEFHALDRVLTQRNLRLVLEVDDDLFSVPSRDRLVSEGYPLGNLETIHLIAQRSAAIITSTPRLAQVIRDAGITTQTHAIPNRLDPTLWFASEPRSVPTPSSVPRPVYVGSTTHAEDLNLLAKLPTELSARYGEPVVIDVVGVTSDDGLPDGFRRVDIPSSSYPSFVRWFAHQRGRWTVGLAPLSDDPLNSSKSELKILDYAAIGLPTIASARAPYSDYSEHIRIVGDSIEDWASAIVSDHTAHSFHRAEALLQRRWLDDDSVANWLSKILGPRTRPTCDFSSREVRVISAATSVPSRPRTAAIMAHSGPCDLLPPHTRYTIENISTAVDLVVLVSTTGVGPQNVLPANVIVAERPHYGGDFFSYKAGIETLHDLSSLEQLLLCNDSFVGPVVPVSEILAHARLLPCDVMGMTISQMYRRHVEPYFMTVNQRAIRSDAFRHFWADMMPLSSAANAMANHGLGFSHHMVTAGLNLGSFFEESDAEASLGRARHSLHHPPSAWGTTPSLALADRVLLERRLPVVRLAAFADPYRLGTMELLNRCEQLSPTAFDGVRERLSEQGLILQETPPDAREISYCRDESFI